MIIYISGTKYLSISNSTFYSNYAQSKIFLISLLINNNINKDLMYIYNNSIGIMQILNMTSNIAGCYLMI